MITGSIILNNVTDSQLVQVMQAKASNEGKLFFNPSQIQNNQPGGNPTLNSHVAISWNEDVGFRAALALAHALLGETATLTKAA